MGYRHYIYEVDARLVEKIRACKTNEEYGRVCIENIPTYHGGAEYDYFPIYNLGRELFEFGKYYENADEMYKHGDSLFGNAALREEYRDYEPIVLDKSGLLCAIEWQANRVRSIYEDLLLEKSELNEFDTRTQHMRMREHIESHQRWWQWGACDLDESREHLVRSWLYEHTIFDLVRIYKSFDWENKRLVFFGY